MEPEAFANISKRSTAPFGRVSNRRIIWPGSLKQHSVVQLEAGDYVGYG